MLSFFLLELLRQGETVSQPEGRLTGETLRSFSCLLWSRQLPWEEQAGIPAPRASFIGVQVALHRHITTLDKTRH